MENLFICAEAQHLLKKNKKQLEERHQVEIRIPQSSLNSDVLLISIHGEKRNRDCIKKFLSGEMKKFQPANNDRCKEDVIAVTLTDSDDEVTHLRDDYVTNIKPSSSIESSFSPIFASTNLLNDSGCIVESSATDSVMNIKPLSSTKSSLFLPIFRNALTESSNLFDDSICIIESSTYMSDTAEVLNCDLSNPTKMPVKKRKHGKNKKRNKKVKISVLSSSDDEVSDGEVTSTTNDMTSKEIVDCDESICLLSEMKKKKSTDFIPLHKTHFNGIVTNHNLYNRQQQKCAINDDIIELPRRLRPIVIDGSNVAREHGRTSNCFSVEGIILAIDFFWRRGHRQITAFVPNFRRYNNPNRAFPTTHPEILEMLAKKQLLVFTPSRRLNGKCISFYDDRFIVELAAINGGVIVSNDNYRDLIDESTSFKEAIERRLLMFCFAGDVFMPTRDPLGRYGPKLNDYLSFPS